ncbi:hypothetical protein VOLCADRAFT_120508 [Volvox carteri f. nagariensis]|uniref:Uncharacterized protein n=1 Tax=Volvox carteri f. nagariensis TaxID=3068 RepID=D8TMU6_VOLCA|nr:uncharacterized protein VOLCADRAFT_120508 [Volvox carteri f. nagariensis]EFJ51187.1 hypothetical protein VOLCADRAFT_120508 [Volvox carteri f. nagariensis]|eukprot:XP_002947654.1 hypothetical protein VOLCADRAFT_120508 [Volvox carteri f. nagariensis]
MKTDRRSVVLVSSVAPPVGATRGHRSLGDGENLALGIVGRRSGSIQDRTNINTRGWNNSTRASPLWKRKTQENKENGKLPISKKFQHVQSKLAAPVFTQRRLKQVEVAEKPGAASTGGPLQAAADVLNVAAPSARAVPSENTCANGPLTSVPFDFFVTRRSRGLQQQPEEDFFTDHEQLSSNFAALGPNVRSMGDGPDQQQTLCIQAAPLTSPLPESLLQGYAATLSPQAHGEPNGDNGPMQQPVANKDLEGDKDAAIAPCKPELTTGIGEFDTFELSVSIASAGVTAAAQADSPTGSAASVAFWGRVSDKDSEHSRESPVAAPLLAGGVEAEHLDESSPSAKSTEHAADGSSSAPSVPPSPIEVISPAAASPEGAMLSPGGRFSPQAAAAGPTAPYSHQQSAGLSFASRPAQPVAYAKWATLAGKVEQTPGGLSDCHGPTNMYADSPQQSAGLSVVSTLQRAVAFDVWASVQRARAAQSAAGDMHSPPGPYAPSPLSSVGPDTVVKPGPAGSWIHSPASTPVNRAESSTDDRSPAAHIRCNPLFEIDSPASSISALPERADALGGLAPTPSPSPARMLSAPSLASTPMSAFSQVHRSSLTSPMGECSPGHFDASVFDAVGTPTSALAMPGPELQTSTETAFPTNTGNVGATAQPSCPEEPSRDLEAKCPDISQSPMQGEASCFGPTVNNIDRGENRSPSPSESAPRSPSCTTPKLEDPAVVLEEVRPRATSSASPKEMSSPAADSVITTKFAASPVEECNSHGSTGAEVPPAMQTTHGGLADTDTEDLNPEQSPSTSVYATPLGEFPTPTTLASLCSAICLTGMQTGAGVYTPSGQGHLAGAAVSSDFTFGFRNMQLVGSDPRLEAPTPVLGPGVPAPTDGASASHVAPALGLGLQFGTGFGSPLPLTQLTPMQMRALDQMAGRVIAALSPARKPVSPRGQSSVLGHVDAVQEPSASDAEPLLGRTAVSAAFNLAQLLANLRSPLPAPVHQRSRFAPDQERTDTASAGVVESSAGWAEDVPASISPSDTHTTVGPASNGDAAPVPVASPMPNFARLMAFLNGCGRAATAPAGGTDLSSRQAQSDEAEIPPGACDSRAAAVDLGQLLAHLHSPLPNQSEAPSGDSGIGSGCVDSPITAHGGHDSPATSEAASFGFSTAAKQMASRITPSTTPGGGGISFVRWAQETGPPSFRLDSDAPHVRGRLARTPPTPMSFSFGVPFGMAPPNDEITPAVGNGRLAHLRSSLATVDAGRPLYSTSASPARSRASFSFNATPANGRVPNGSATGSPAFSFGAQMGAPNACVATPTAPFGPNAAQDTFRPTEVDAAESAVRGNVRNHVGNMICQNRDSPAISLGIWRPIPFGGEPLVGPEHSSQTPSQRGFTFDNVASSLMATPMWPGLGAAATIKLATDRPDADFIRDMGIALEQLAVAASPTLFNMTAQGSPQQSPGISSSCETIHADRGSATDGLGASGASLQDDVYTPAAAFLWTTLLGNLCSPMPAGVHARSYHGQQTKQQAPPAADAPSSLGTLPAGALVDALSSTSIGSVPDSLGPADPLLANEVTGFVTPPPYEDLPDLIARGLCLSAPAPAQPLEDVFVPGLAPDTCSVIGENPTPLVCRASCEHLPANLLPAASDVPLEEVGVLGQLFQPVDELQAATAGAASVDSPDAFVQSPSGQLIIESSSDSNRNSAGTLYAANMTASDLTALDVAGPQESACGGAPDIREDSVRSSPVFSFHVASEGSVRSVGSTVPVAAAVPSTDMENPVLDDALNDSSYGIRQPQEDGEYRQCDTPAESTPQPKGITFSVDAVPRLLFDASVDSKAAAAEHRDRVTLEACNRRIRANADLLLDFQGSPGHIAPTVPVASVTGTITPRLKAAGLSAAWQGTHAQVGHTQKNWEEPHGTCSHLLAHTTTALQVGSASVATAPDDGHKPKDLSVTAPGAAVASAPQALSADSSTTGQLGAAASALEGKDFAEGAQAGPRARALQQGQGPPLQQLVATGIEHALASATAVVVQHSSIAAVGHLPLSHRLGLWPAAAWGIPCIPPTAAASSGPVAAGSANSGLPREVANQVQADTICPAPHAAAQAKPAFTSRDVQTTPGLIKMDLDYDGKVDGGLATQASEKQRDSAPGQPGLALQGLGNAVNRKQVYRSRIPLPGGTIAPMPAASSSTTQESGASKASNSDGEESSGGTGPAATERVVRWRRLLSCPAAAGGPRRVLVKRDMQRNPVQEAAEFTTSGASKASDNDGEESNGGTGPAATERVVRWRRLLSCPAAAGGPRRVLNPVQEAAEFTTLGEEEMRRRAHVMGMRISPYLRTKPPRVRPPEAPTAQKG